MNRALIVAALIALLPLPGAAQEQEQAQEQDAPQAPAAPLRISLGAGLQFASWEGENRDSSETSFKSDDGGLLGFSVMLQKGRFYGGVTFQGGEFDFSDGSPDRVGESDLPGGSVSADEATIERGEADFLFGYYFWERYSLFLDLKSVSNEWADESYSLRYGGLGGGASGFWPLNERWSLFGTFGLVPLVIRADGDRIGKGFGSALTFGGVFRLFANTSLVFAVKNQHQEYDFDNGAEQTHDIGGLSVAINHRFDTQW